jgi:hypothetical protein
VVSTWINEAQTDLARARTDLALLNNEVPTELSQADLVMALGDMPSLVRSLSTAFPTTKVDLYRDRGLRLTYQHGSGEAGAEVGTAEACETWSPREEPNRLTWAFDHRRRPVGLGPQVSSHTLKRALRPDGLRPYPLSER